MTSRRILIVLPAMLILSLFASTAASGQEVSFTDIGSAAQREAVGELAAAEIVRGCDTGRYCPGDSLNRAHVAALMDRALGLSAGSGLDAALSGADDADTVPETSYDDTRENTHRVAIEAVTEAGLMIGCNAGEFCPNDPITRGQLATVLQRAFDLPSAPAGTDYYVDAGDSHLDGINAITAAGVSNGCDLVYFCTNQPLNRGHAAIFIARALNLVERVEIGPFDERRAAYDVRVAAEEEAAAAAAAKAEAEAEARAKREAELAPGRRAVEVAMAQVGKPYQWGGNGPGSYDCSGLTSFAWRAAGKELPRTSRMQYSATTRVSRSELRPGDLVFYHSPISHVAMYIGDGKVVEAANSRYNVRVRNDGLTRAGIVGYGRP